MPEINLPQLFSTLGIGIFSAIYIWYLGYLGEVLFFKRDTEKSISATTTFLNLLKKIKEVEFSVSALSVTAFILLFGLGTFINDGAHELTNTNASQPKIVIAMKRLAGLELKNEIVLRLLITKDDSLTNFGKKIFTNDSIISTVNNTMNCDFFKSEAGTDINSYWSENCYRLLHGKDNSIFQAYISEIGFLSKNWCYLCTGNVAEELRTTDHKIHFSRCIAIVSAIFLLLLIVLYFFYWIYVLYKRLFYKVKFKKVHYSKISPVLILIFLQISSRFVYPISQENFNKRILGYYLNHFSYHTDFK